MDIGGHPPIPLAQKQLFQFGIFFMIFQGHFEALNDVFLASQQPMQYPKALAWTYSTIVFFVKTFPMVSQVTQMKIICKIYTPGKLTYQLTTSWQPLNSL